MAVCQICGRNGAVHLFLGKVVCINCAEDLARTDEGKAVWKPIGYHAAMKKANGDFIASLSVEEKKAEDEIISTQIKAQNARQGKYVTSEDVYRKHYKGE